MLLYINFCFYFDTRNLSSNDIIYLTRVSLPLTSSRRGWSRYIDIQRLVNIFSDRNSSTGCFVTLRFPFFFFLLAEIRSGNRGSFHRREDQRHFVRMREKFRVNSLIESPFLLLRWKKKIDSNSPHDLLTQFSLPIIHKLICNSCDR